MLQFPFPKFTVGFQAFQPVDMGNLSELALVAGASSGDYSNESTNGYTITRDGVAFNITGSGFTYTGGLPDAGGRLEQIHVTGPTSDYQFANLTSINFSVAEFNALFGTGNAHTIAATLLAGDNEIDEGNFGGTLHGFGGNDWIIGGGPDNHVIFGGAGNDTLQAGSGNDSLYGGPGNDLLVAGRGNDYLNGGPGNNTALFGQSFFAVSVTLNGNNPVIAHVGFAGHDTLVHIENLMGGLAPDKFIGDSHNNQLVGGTGNDTLSGGAGNDTLDGSYSRDAVTGNVLTGGPGRDVFLFDTPFTKSVANFNTITDFQRGIDKIWLDTGTFEDLTSDGHLPAGYFIAGPHLTHDGLASLVYDTVTGDLYYGPNGRIAHFDHHPHLHASDFFVISETVPLGHPGYGY